MELKWASVWTIVPSSSRSTMIRWWKLSPPAPTPAQTPSTRIRIWHWRVQLILDFGQGFKERPSTPWRRSQSTSLACRAFTLDRPFYACHFLDRLRTNGMNGTAGSTFCFSRFCTLYLHLFGSWSGPSFSSFTTRAQCIWANQAFCKCFNVQFT